jgi:putative transposase
MKVTAPRQIVPGRFYLITRRCSERRFFLKPDTLTTHLFRYALAEAAKRFGIRLIAFFPMSNHYHAVVEDLSGNLPEFLCHFHKMAARSINCRWKRWEGFWAAEPASVVHLVTPADVLDKTIYTLVNAVAAYLVEQVHHWPGASSFALLDGRVETIHRPTTFYREDGTMPVTVELRAEAPTGWDGGAAAWAAAVKAGVERRVREINEERQKKGIRVVGRRALLDVAHTSMPRTTEPRRGLRPVLACLDARRRIAELDALKWFRKAYASARDAFVAGRDALFPWGTYKLMHEAAAKCQPAPASRGQPCAASSALM